MSGLYSRSLSTAVARSGTPVGLKSVYLWTTCSTRHWKLLRCLTAGLGRHGSSGEATAPVELTNGRGVRIGVDLGQGIDLSIIIVTGLTVDWTPMPKSVVSKKA